MKVKRALEDAISQSHRERISAHLRATRPELNDKELNILLDPITSNTGVIESNTGGSRSSEIHSHHCTFIGR